MLGSGGGVIVNVSSVATRGVNRVPYSAAKGGVNALTASLAFEYAGHGIRVCAVAPGGTDAPPRRIPRNARRRPSRNEAGIGRWWTRPLASSLMHRYGTMDEQAAAILFLASDEASYITGTPCPSPGATWAKGGRTTMIDALLKTSPIPNLLDKLAGLDQPGGDPRLKQIVQRVVGDLFKTIDDFDVTPAEFWAAMSYLTEMGQTNEGGLLAAGPGLRALPRPPLRREGAPGRAGGRHAAHDRRAALAGRRAAVEGRGAAGPGPGDRRGAVHARPGARHGGQPGAARDRGRVARQHARAATRSSTSRRAPTTCAATSRRTPRAATGSAPSCPPATAARRTGRRRSC